MEARKQPLSREIAEQVTAPTRTLLQVELRYQWRTFHDLRAAVPDPVREDRHSFDLRLGVPFDFWGVVDVLHLDLEYVALAPSGLQGLGPATIFDLVLFQFDWGKIGIGPTTLLLPQRRGVSLQAGPALGIVAVKGKLVFGGLNQNLFGEGPSLLLLRPFFAYTPLDWLVLSLPQADFILDWEHLRWVSIPLGLNATTVARIEDRFLTFTFGAYYNVGNFPGVPGWTIRASIGLIASGAAIEGPW